MALETYASSGSSATDQIDGGSLATDVLNAGSLGVGTFASAVDTPSVSSLVTVSFTATGQIRSGSHTRLWMRVLRQCRLRHRLV